MPYDVYQEPLTSRYTSIEMQKLFSEETKFQTWRQCWVALAEAQYELGLTGLVTVDMINSMRENITNIDTTTESKNKIKEHLKKTTTDAVAATNPPHIKNTSRNCYKIKNTKMNHD